MIDTQKIDQRVEEVFIAPTTGRVQRLLQSKLGLWVIAAISFFESALPVPLITDPFLVAGILADRSRALLVTVVTIVSSILGGLAAFAMASFFFEAIEKSMTESMRVQFHQLVSFGASDTLVTTITGAITPVPYTITAYVVAAAGGGVWLFIVGSLIGRTIRYAVVGYCTYIFGPAALRYARRSLTVTSIVVAMFVVLYIWLKL